MTLNETIAKNALANSINTSSNDIKKNKSLSDDLRTPNAFEKTLNATGSFLSSLIMPIPKAVLDSMKKSTGTNSYIDAVNQQVVGFIDIFNVTNSEKLYREAQINQQTQKVNAETLKLSKQANDYAGTNISSVLEQSVKQQNFEIEKQKSDAVNSQLRQENINLGLKVGGSLIGVSLLLFLGLKLFGGKT